MNPSIWIAIASCLASGFFAACNIALKTYSRTRLSELLEPDAAKPAPNGKSDRFFRDTPKLQLMTAMLRTAMTFVVLLAILHTVEDRWPAGHRILRYLVAFAIAAVLVSICTVAIPTAWARYHPERLLASSRRPLLIFLALFKPLAEILYLFDPFIRRLTGVSLNPPNHSQVGEEVMSVVQEHQNHGTVVDPAQRQMLEAVFELPSITAGEVMTPRTDIQGLDVHSTLEEIKAAVAKEGHSRIPVYDSSLDHILGILYAKDIIKFLGTVQPVNLRQIIREALMVPASKPLRELLAEFKARKVHLAIVIDEYGGTAGLVTIEDIIEEIVGDIQDEYEPKPEPALLRKIDAKTTEADARIRVDELNKQLDLDLPTDNDYDTLGGFVISTFGRIPAPQQHFDHHGHRFTVIQAQPNKVTRIKIEELETEMARDNAAGG